MRIALLTLAVGLTMATGSAAAEDIARASNVASISPVAEGAIPWEARWTGDADPASVEQTTDDAEITSVTQSGPPTPIVPAAYAGYSRPATLR